MIGVLISVVLLGMVFLLFCVVRVSTPYDCHTDDVEQEKFLKKVRD